MKDTFERKALGIAGALILAACNASGSSVPSGAFASQAHVSPMVGGIKTYNFSGEYSGLVTDSVHGAGKASMRLSQAKTALGGSLTIADSSTVDYVSWTAAGTSVDGSSVFVAASGYCSFLNTGTYDTKTSVLVGSYKAVHGCAGERGTYKLRHHCYYKWATNDVRPDGGPHPC